MHRVMRGMFPLQVIRYLRGDVVARRLEKRKREGRRARREKTRESYLVNEAALASVMTRLSND